VTLGETITRLFSPNNERIERADYLYLRIGGAESNVALEVLVRPPNAVAILRDESLDPGRVGLGLGREGGKR